MVSPATHWPSDNLSQQRTTATSSQDQQRAVLRARERRRIESAAQVWRHLPPPSSPRGHSVTINCEKQEIWGITQWQCFFIICALLIAGRRHLDLPLERGTCENKIPVWPHRLTGSQSQAWASALGTFCLWRKRRGRGGGAQVWAGGQCHHPHSTWISPQEIYLSF